jgi:hypothetical protein
MRQAFGLLCALALIRNWAESRTLLAAAVGDGLKPDWVTHAPGNSRQVAKGAERRLEHCENWNGAYVLGTDSDFFESSLASENVGLR